MLDGQRAWGRLPYGMRVPVAAVLFLTAVVLAAGMLVSATQRDRTVAAVDGGLMAIADELLAAGPTILDQEGERVLWGAVVERPALRAARVLRAGSTVVDVGSWSGATDLVRSVPFAHADGQPLVLEVEGVAPASLLGWETAALLWAVLSAGILGIGVAFERGRRSHVGQLEGTVRALTARDTLVAAERQELLESKTGFVRAVSHELRTPLHVIRGVGQLLATKGDAVPPAQREQLLARLVANCDRLDALVQDLIDVDRLTSRTAIVQRRDVEVARTVGAVLAELDPGDHRLVVDVDGVVAHVTPGHLERIVHHLLHNAVKYAPDGTTVRVTAQREGERVELVVADEGPGVPAGDRFRIFEPLRRSKDDGPQPGLGLGLALVKRLAELHGGRVWVDDAPGGGAAFHVTLPDAGRPLEIDDWDLPTHVAPVGPSLVSE